MKPVEQIHCRLCSPGLPFGLQDPGSQVLPSLLSFHLHQVVPGAQSSLGCPGLLWLRLVHHGRVRQHIPACHVYLVVHLCRDSLQSEMAETGLKKKMQSHFLYNLYEENVLNAINLLLLFNLITEPLPERISCYIRVAWPVNDNGEPRAWLIRYLFCDCRLHLRFTFPLWIVQAYHFIEPYIPYWGFKEKRQRHSDILFRKVIGWPYIEAPQKKYQ